MVNRHRQSRGYVLVMVLAVIALAGLAMTGTARRVLVASRDARAARGELQRRWAVLSLQHLALENGDKWLAAGRREARLSLAGVDLQARIDDEGAKLSATALLGEVGKTQAERIVREFVRKKGSLAEVRIEAWSPPVARGEKRRPGLQGLGQVFPTASAAELMTLGQWVTVWGEGGVDPRRAPADVIAARCGPLLSGSQVAALKSVLAADPKAKTDDALGKLALTEEAREKLSSRLVDASGCYSIWMTADDGRRQWHRLAVKTEGDTAAAVTSFEW